MSLWLILHGLQPQISIKQLIRTPAIITAIQLLLQLKSQAIKPALEDYSKLAGWVTRARRPGCLIPLAEELLGWREKYQSSRVSAMARKRPRNFLHCFHAEQPQWILWVSDRAVEILLIWTPREAEGRRSSLPSSEMLMLSSKNRDGVHAISLSFSWPRRAEIRICKVLKSEML